MSEPVDFESPTDPTPRRNSATGETPRWVKVFGIIAAIVVLLGIALLVFGGNHGPSRHMRSDGSAAPEIQASARHT
jgi:hypothetical protein